MASNLVYKQFSAESLQAQRPLVHAMKHFLKGAQQKNWQQTDQISLVMEATQIVTYARFVPFEHTLWLRGLYCIPSHREQGLASTLLAFSAERLAILGYQQIVAFALCELSPFYQKLGYQSIDLSDLEESQPFLAERFKQAQTQTKPWRLMQKTLTSALLV
ncbi:MAG: GNAT family N-acetyltransferase [Thiotrichales bacterium]|nr:GNAT family N-acetyltransferase [Thiotrichales bacterium]